MPDRVCLDCSGSLPEGCSPKRLRCDPCKDKHTKEVAKARTKAWNAANPERKKAAAKAHYDANAEIYRKRAADWHVANKDRPEIKSRRYETSRAWVEAHPERMKELYKKSRSKPENKKKRQAYNKSWFEANPGRRQQLWQDWYVANQDKLRETSTFRRGVYAASDFTFEQWLEIKEEFNHHCAYCLRHESEEGGKLTMDHVLPISKGGPHTKSNIVPACKSCNSRKHDCSIFSMLNYEVV